MVRHRLYCISFDILANQNANNVYSDADVSNVDKKIRYSKDLSYIKMLDLTKADLPTVMKSKRQKIRKQICFISGWRPPAKHC